jgi:hypothetical protein
MRRKLRNPHPPCILLYNVPNHLLCHFRTPQHPGAADPAKNSSHRHASCGQPIIDSPLHPIGNGYRSDMAALPSEIDNRPMLLAALKMVVCQVCQLTSPQSTRLKTLEPPREDMRRSSTALVTRATQEPRFREFLETEMRVELTPGLGAVGRRISPTLSTASR